MSHWWVPGLRIGYEQTFVHQVADFLEGLASGKPASPASRDRPVTERVTDAVLHSAKTGQWERHSG
jgi:myo-inositol 2-dehydrogenase/D-chiro-inositol 1-dehydrogenase